jgi:hypothetical protein
VVSTATTAATCPDCLNFQVHDDELHVVTGPVDTHTIITGGDSPERYAPAITAEFRRVGMQRLTPVLAEFVDGLGEPLGEWVTRSTCIGPCLRCSTIESQRSLMSLVVRTSNLPVLFSSLAVGSLSLIVGSLRLPC